MTDEVQQVEVLRQGAEGWAAWRQRHPEASLDLVGADLAGAKLVGADLATAYLGEANLSEAHLGGADLSDAHLGGADLAGADLTNTDLRQASLIDVHLDGATLTNAKLWETQRTGWSIKGVVCQRVYWDRGSEVPTEYGDGRVRAPVR